MADVVPTPEVQQGPATDPQSGAPQPQGTEASPGQLPKGGAKQVNAAMAEASQETKAAQTEPAQAGAEEPGLDLETLLGSMGSGHQFGGQEAQPEEHAQIQFTPQTDEEKFLFSPNDGPSRHPMHGLTRSGQPAPPQELIDALPAFKEAAATTGAPPQMQALLNLILYHSADVSQNPGQ